MTKRLRILSLQITPLYVWDHGDDGLEVGPQSPSVVVPEKDFLDWLDALPEMVADVETQLLTAEMTPEGR